jgi:hypothetical protein
MYRSSFSLAKGVSEVEAVMGSRQTVRLGQLFKLLKILAGT